PELLPGCTIIYTPEAWLPYVSPSVFETAVFGMMVYRSWIISRQFGSTPLVQRLIL
ncbi:hypothetical protein FRC07_012964, partial [Ceratobasidium sp. 392]